MSERIITFTILMIVLLLVFGNISGAAQHPGGEGPEEKTVTLTENDYCTNPQTDNSRSIWEKVLDLNEGTIIEITFVLSWQDDEGSSSDPDTFRLTAGDGNSAKTDESSNGEGTVSWTEGDLNNSWSLEVACLSAGPTPIGLLGLRQETDPGNSWNLVITYVYVEPSSGGPGGPPPHVVALLASPIFWIHVGLMILSTYTFLLTGVASGVFLLVRNRWEGTSSTLKKMFSGQALTIWLAIVSFLGFFLAAVPIGIWVAGKMYGWANCWTGIPAVWQPDAFSYTNADNVSLIVLILWAIPMYLNRAQIMRSNTYRKLFGWSKFAMRRAQNVKDSRLSKKEQALCYFFMGIFVFLVFMVQPHGSSM